MCAKGGKYNKKSPSHAKKSTKRCQSRNHLRAEKRIISVSKSKEKQKDRKKPSRRPITGRRLWLFRIVALTIIPALLFLLLELGLRVVGYGFPVTATIKCKVNEMDAYGNNVKFGWRFFPRNISRVTDQFIFAADKPDDTYRIFVLGASAAKGTPDAAFSFGRFLQVMLRDRYPGVNFEVINTAMTAINSHVVLEIAKDCARHEPDLFIVYLGNNEVVGPYGPGTVFSRFSSSLSLIRAGIALKATRLGQLLRNLLELADTGRSTPVVWRGTEMFLEKQVRANDGRLESVYAHFQRNLEDIRCVAHKTSTKVIFCSVVSNLKDSPPFASLHRIGLTDAEKKKWDEIYQAGVARERAGEYGKAVERYLAAAEIDDCYADLQFRLGCCYRAMEQYNKARDRYIKALELDTIRFRADMRINEVIRDVAGVDSAEGVYLVDAVKLFEENSPYGITGEELFYEHVHLNYKGNYLLAGAIFRQIEKILPERVRARKAKGRSLLTEAGCARDLAYTGWDRYNIAYKVLNAYIKRAPFTNQLYHNQRVSQMEQQLKGLEIYTSPEALKKAETEYRRALQKAPSDWWLHWKYGYLLSEHLKNDSAAAKECRFLIDNFPYCYKAYAKLGLLLGARGHLDAAVGYNLEAIRIMPTYAYAYYHLGLASQLQGKLDKAIENYSKAIRFKPDHAPSYNNLGILLYQQGRIDKAAEAYRQGLVFVPDSPILHRNLGVLLGKKGRRDEAIKEVRTALQLDPNSVETRRVLKAILERDRQNTKTPEHK